MVKFGAPKGNGGIEEMLRTSFPGLTVRMPREWYLYVTAQARKEGMKPGDWVARFLVTELTKKGVKP